MSGEYFKPSPSDESDWTEWLQENPTHPAANVDPWSMYVDPDGRLLRLSAFHASGTIGITYISALRTGRSEEMFWVNEAGRHLSAQEATELIPKLKRLL